MEIFVNLLLIVGTLSAATFSWVLSRRVRKLSDLDQGLGSAITTLSSQVDDMNEALMLAQQQASASSKEIETLTTRAEKAAGRLELLLAGLHEAETDQSTKDADDARARKRNVAQMRRQKRLEAQNQTTQSRASGDPVNVPPNHPSRQEMIDSITKTIGTLQR